MPLLTTPDCRHGNGTVDGREEATASRIGPEDTDARELVIGLLNNMPDAALEATERQFADLLNAAAGEIPVRVRLFALPDVPRGEDARRSMSARYGSIDELATSRPDALIVTGTEPRAHRLTDEPYWKSLTAVLEWAQENTLSAVWSCLAAQRLLDSFPSFVESRLTPMARASAVRLYANWLSYVSARKHQTQTFRFGRMTQRVLRKAVLRRQSRGV